MKTCKTSWATARFSGRTVLNRLCYLFSYFLFNDAVSGSYFTVLDERMNNLGVAYFKLGFPFVPDLRHKTLSL